MLELRNLVKSYNTAGFVQQALDDVSVTLRDNEFVAVLGPSGSGKTTLLNIVGGLDHYDSGDLVIDGISTKEYRDKDWDTYRNNRIGFVFQSYNLIPHQSVLSNVELALTLSGVSKTERRARAREALAQVGLEEHISKKPSQLSGGQMQRVAIARALINDPEILLADEPTGALDSKTSVQIMDLLKQIATDRLVVMVTHNPDLADEYANRIIKLSDGKVVNDSNPVVAIPPAPEAREARRARMSFFTAVALSFSNLMTKKGRTLMMAFAGSIGIIGIASILALSNGVNNYIKSVEEDTLSVYPLAINAQGFDMTSMLVGSTASDPDEDGSESSGTSNGALSMFGMGSSGEGEDEGIITESPMVTTMFDQVKSNDLAALKEYLDGSESGIMQYVNTIQYEYDVTPQIYLPQTEPEVHQVNPDRSFSALGLGSGMSSSSIVSMGMSTDMFDELLSDYDIYSQQYEVLAGDWPASSDEILLVLGSSHRVSDFMLYSMGLRDYTVLNSMIEAFINEEPVVTPSNRLSFTYDEILDVEFKLVYNSDYYLYDSTYDVWVDHSDDAEHLKKLVSEGKTLRISGIVAAREGTQTLVLSPGLYYTPALVEDIVQHSETSDVTQDQLDNPNLNIFTNKTFLEEAEQGAENDFDMSNLFSIDEEAMGEAFQMDESAFSGLDFGGVLDPAAVMAAMPPLDLGSALANVPFNTAPSQGMQTALQNVMASMMGLLASDYADWYMSQLPTPVLPPGGGGTGGGTGGGAGDGTGGSGTGSGGTGGAGDGTGGSGGTGNGGSTGGYPIQEIGQHFGDYLQTPRGQALIASALSPDNPALAAYQNEMAAAQAQTMTALQEAITTYMQQYMTTMLTIMSQQISTNMQNAMAGLTENMANAMRIDEEAFANAFQFNLDEDELTALMLSMMGGEESSYAGNLRHLGYVDFAEPFQISIYPVDFEGKQSVLDILDAYNQRMEDDGHEEQVISYTDIVGTLMSSVTTIIDMISMVLVAFVAISLVVSSIMIGVITYISVLERKKEIGILRSIGASKGDIANVFNAETLIVGFVAGCMGIGITLLLAIPANIIVLNLFDIPDLVLLPWAPALILIGVSCFLTFVAGLIPSSAASNKDPVEALRSE